MFLELDVRDLWSGTRWSRWAPTGSCSGPTREHVETLVSSFAFIKKTDQSVVRGRPLYFSPMQRARVDYADISEEDRANILRNTAAGLLGLEPAASSL